MKKDEVRDANAMVKIGQLVHRSLRKAGPKWSFVLVCRREADEEDGEYFESSVSDMLDPAAAMILSRAANRLRVRGSETPKSTVSEYRP